MLGERVTVAPVKSYVKPTGAVRWRPRKNDLALLAGILRPFGQRLQKWIRGCRRFDLPLECGFRAYHVPIEFSGAVFVLTNDAAIQRYSGEDSASSRVAQDLGAHLPIGPGCGLAADWAGGDAGVCT